jgi:glutathione S-transferase
MLELYHWEPTTNSAEPLICLEEKELEYESHYVNLLAFEQHTPAFLEMNPLGQVPVLRHDGRILTESSLMLQYLDATFPQTPLSPQTATDRYRMHVWLRTSDDYFAPALCLLGWHLTESASRLAPASARTARAGLARLPAERQAVWIAALDGYGEEQLTAARNALGIVATRMEAALATTGWLAGPAYSLADIAIFPMARALARLLPELLSEEATPHSMQWLRRVVARPAVTRALRRARTAAPEAMFAPGPEPGRWG